MTELETSTIYCPGETPDDVDACPLLITIKRFADGTFASFSVQCEEHSFRVWSLRANSETSRLRTDERIFDYVKTLLETIPPTNNSIDGGCWMDRLPPEKVGSEEELALLRLKLAGRFNRMADALEQRN